MNDNYQPLTEEYYKQGDCFTVTGQHLKLIERYSFVWDFSDFGAIQVDPKRPYGNRDVFEDVGKILGIEEVFDENFGYGKEYENTVKKLHNEAAMALLICASCLKFEIGTYIYNGHKWEKGE